MLKKATTTAARIKRQAINYFNMVAWLLYSAFEGRTRSFIGALFLSFLHLGGQGAAIFAIYWWARQMEQNGTVSVPLLGIQFAAREEPALLWAVMIFSAVCLMAGACSLFVSRMLVLNIVRDNYAQSLDRMAFFTSRLPDPRARAASQLLLRYGLKGLAMGCRRVALTAIEFANAIPAVMGSAGAASFLFGVYPLLTLLILLASVSGAALLYPLALRGANVAKHLQQAQIAFKSEMRRLKSAQALSPLKLKTSTALAQASLASRRVRTELAFAIGIGVSVILIFVVYYLASGAKGRSEGWAIFIAYIGALRLALAGGSHAIAAIASVSRFYPQIMRYYVFVKNVRMLDKSSLGKVRRGDELILGVLKNGADIVVSVGQRIALITTDTLRQMRSALVGARVSHSALPLGTAVLDKADASIGGAAIALVDLNLLTNGRDGSLLTSDERLDDAVTLIIHRDAQKVGAAGETHLLALRDGEFRRFAPLGTSESGAALEEFSRKMRREKNRIDEDDDEDDDEAVS